MNYNNYGYTPNILNPTNIEPLGSPAGIDKAIDTVQKYKAQLYSSNMINYKGD
jgi:hypothetical protein